MTGPRETVGVIGSGVAGLTAAHLLQRRYDVTLFEADDRLGGHAHTHELTASDGGTTDVDSGFIVHKVRDLAADFAAVGAQPVGISGDSVLEQSVFATSHSLGYPLLSDEGHEVAKEFGAWRWWLPGGLHTRRQTFVIGQGRRIVAAFASESKFDAHADEALTAVKKQAAG
jgi:peroxiredoxin Q/BCP